METEPHNTAPSLRTWPWFGWFHPAWPAAVWMPVALGAIGWGLWKYQVTWWQVISCAVAALLAWSLFEYLIHRFVLHPAEHLQRIDRFAYYAHGKHHDEPDHPAYALMPPINAAFILIPLLTLFYFAVAKEWLEIFTGFFLLGYLAYEYVHFAIHQSVPSSRLTQYLRRHHLTHHAHGRAGNFGVSTPIWDFVFQSTLEKQTKPSQPEESEARTEPAGRNQ